MHNRDRGVGLMAGRTRIEIEGDKELIRKLNKMSQGFRSKALLHAVTQGGEIVKREASARAPVRKSGRGGTLSRSITVVKLKETNKLAKVAVSWRKGRASRTAAFYGIMVEKGTGPRHKKKRKSKGLDRAGRSRSNLAVGRAGSTGTMPSRPFLIPAYDSKRTEVARQIKIELSRLLRKAAKKGM